MAARTSTSAFSLAGRTAWARNLAVPLRDYLNTEARGARGGAAMSTDTAFVLGVLALVAPNGTAYARGC